MLATRTFIVASGLCLASATQAQSSVRIYGAMDAWVGQQRNAGAPARSVVNSGFNPNSLGFAGTEDLGGGLKAGFILEAQPVLDTGGLGQGGKFFGRQSNVYLSHADWGRLSIGRVQTWTRAFGIKYSSTGWLATDPMGTVEVAMGNSITPTMNTDGSGGRFSNALAYETPKVAGLSGSFLQSLGEGGPFSAGQGKVSVLGLAYANGPLNVDVVASYVPKVQGSQVRQMDFGLGVTYELGDLRLQAAALSRSGSAVALANATTAIPGSQGTNEAVVVGASMAIASTSRVGLSFGRLVVSAAQRGRLAANIGSPTAMDSLSTWSVAYNYAFSRHTTWFAAYGTAGNGARGAASLTAGLPVDRGGRSSLLASGLRTSF